MANTGITLQGALRMSIQSAKEYEMRVPITDGGCNGIDVTFLSREEMMKLMKNSYDNGHIDWDKFNQKFSESHPWLDEHCNIRPEWKGRLDEIKLLNKQAEEKMIQDSSYISKTE